CSRQPRGCVRQAAPGEPSPSALREHAARPEAQGGCGRGGGPHLRQDKLEIIEDEGILPEVKPFPCWLQEKYPCSCPGQLQTRSLRTFGKTSPLSQGRWHARSKPL